MRSSPSPLSPLSGAPRTPSRSRALATIGAATLAVAAALAAGPAAAAALKAGEPGRQVEVAAGEGSPLPHLLYLPAGFPEGAANYALLLFLHGAGERGGDLSRVAIQGPPLLATQPAGLPLVVVSPLCPAGAWWSDDERQAALLALLDRYVADPAYRIDAARVYVSGLSMGGFGTFTLGARAPERFAALAPVCGAGDPRRGDHYRDLAVWIYHGANDDVVRPEESVVMYQAIKYAGNDRVGLTLFPAAGHNSWDATYGDPAFWTWLLAQRRPAP